MKTAVRFLLFSLLIFLLASCNPNGEMQIKQVNILKTKHFPNLSSASEVAFVDGKIYLVGDDLPFLFELDPEWNILEKHQISGIDSIVHGRTPKSIKADMEAMGWMEYSGRNHLLILCSGSQKITRDTLFLVDIPGKKPARKKSLRPMYDAILKEAGFTSERQINIEALAITPENIFLMHRGNVSENMVISFKRNAFMDYIEKDDLPVPDFVIYPFRLPEFDTTFAGFSGASYLHKHQGLLFTASLEATANEYDDGTVYGSYIGFIPLDGIPQGNIQTKLLQKDGKTLQKKLEGITIKSQAENKIVVLCVSDNDNGTSDLFEMELITNK